MDRGRARQVAVLLAYVAAGLLAGSVVFLQIERIVRADAQSLSP